MSSVFTILTDQLYLDIVHPGAHGVGGVAPGRQVALPIACSTIAAIALDCPGGQLCSCHSIFKEGRKMRANLASIALALAWSSIDAEGGLDLQELNLLDDVWLCPSRI